MNIDDINFTKEITAKHNTDPKKSYRFLITISLEKNTKVIRFLDLKHKEKLG